MSLEVPHPIVFVLLLQPVQRAITHVTVNNNCLLTLIDHLSTKMPHPSLAIAKVLSPAFSILLKYLAVLLAHAPEFQSLTTHLAWLSTPGPPAFWHVTLKSWDGPRNEVMV